MKRIIILILVLCTMLVSDAQTTIRTFQAGYTTYDKNGHAPLWENAIPLVMDIKFYSDTLCLIGQQSPIHMKHTGITENKQKGYYTYTFPPAIDKLGTSCVVQWLFVDTRKHVTVLLMYRERGYWYEGDITK